MNATRTKHALHLCLWGLLPGLLLLIAAISKPTPPAVAAGAAAVTGVTAVTNPSDDAPLCRFGVNVTNDINDTDLSPLRVGWYMNFGADANPPRPNSIEYMPAIRFLPDTSAQGYTYAPSGADLLDVIASNPGAKWLISNEPDSPFQDNLEPAVYARAYHELYYLIKGHDPTAKIIIGSIVQATPVRLLYLDRVLISYHAQYNDTLPTDGWSIHNYILNEVSCDYDPSNCWGADIPPGIEWPYGEVWGIRDNDRVDIFIERITRFRQWLANRGYTGQPVYLTEYSVLMPADFIDEDGNAFPPARVNAFMAGTYNYMLAATDPILGDPNDGYRLVQQWAWFSTTEDIYNGSLFNRDTYTLTEIGNFFAGYTASLNDEVDFYPSRISAGPPLPFSQGEPVTTTLHARIANSGNLATPITTTVRFYDAHPQNGGSQIGAEQSVSLRGCGDNQDVTVVWSNIPPGAYDVYVQVTADTGEINTDNNIAAGRILIGTEIIFLPTIRRSLP